MFSRFTPLNLVILLTSNPLINQRLRRGWKNDHDLLDPPSFSFRLANRYEAVQLRFGFTVRISSKVSSQTSFPVTSSVVSPLHGEPRYLLNTMTNVDDRTELVSVWYFFWRKKRRARAAKDQTDSTITAERQARRSKWGRGAKTRDRNE